MNNPGNSSLIHLIEKRLNAKVIPYYATVNDIVDQFKLYKADIKEELIQLLSVEKVFKISLIRSMDSANAAISLLREKFLI